jgi:hypothetical protein
VYVADLKTVGFVSGDGFGGTGQDGAARSIVNCSEGRTIAAVPRDGKGKKKAGLHGVKEINAQCNFAVKLGDGSWKRNNRRERGYTRFGGGPSGLSL